MTCPTVLLIDNKQEFIYSIHINLEEIFCFVKETNYNSENKFYFKILFLNIYHFCINFQTNQYLKNYENINSKMMDFQ